MSFTQWVVESLMIGAQIYKTTFLDYDYLVYSSEFVDNPYYIISSREYNFAHLTGVRSLIPSYDFYVACINGTVKETDFNFIDRYNDEKSVKGTVRRKLKCILSVSDFFSYKLQAEENFVKGKVHCCLASANARVTMGFIESGKIFPKTMLKGNCLNLGKAVDISLVLRRERGANQFDKILYGDIVPILTAQACKFGNQ